MGPRVVVSFAEPPPKSGNPTSVQIPNGGDGRGELRPRTSMSQRTFFFSVFLLTTLLSTPCRASRDRNLFTQSDSASLRGPTSRGFVSASDLEQPQILLQEDGLVDFVKVFFLQIPDGLATDDISFVQSSSNEEVLKISDNGNLLISSSSAGTLNVTCALSFDAVVGKTNYTIIAMNKDTNEVIGEVTVPFTIVGMSFFTEAEDGSKTVVSGDGNGYEISYDQVLDGNTPDALKIKVFVQYPDGSSSSDSPSTELPFGESLQTSTVGYSAQFLHDAEKCDPANIGSISDTGKLELARGCGYGFYSDSTGGLYFGVLFQPYRVGNVTIQYTWPGITTSNQQLSAEAFEFSVNFFITGQPPVAILAVDPQDKVWRPEGGEIIRFDVINAASAHLSSFRLVVFNVDTHFKVLTGSFHTAVSPNFTESISFATESGHGVDLNWTMEYEVITGAGNSTKVASLVPGFSHAFSYDSQSLRIDSLEPNFGEEEGGEEITVSGYFPFFNAKVDGLYFSGYKLPANYIVSTSETSLSFILPPKSELGESFEFLVKVKMGNAESNTALFSFVLKNAVVRISQSGTSEIDEETYRVGDCTPVRFTAVVTPFTNQVLSYQWSLHVASDLQNDLLQTPAFVSSNSSAQTLVLDPDAFDAGVYSLKLRVNILGKDLEKEIVLLREHIVSIGAFILNPPDRTIAFPDTPLRLSAIVQPPGECYSGNQTMMFEWTAFGEKKVFSSTNATGAPVAGNFTTTPARLGWEYVVPRESLAHGNNSVLFKVWMAEDESVFGQAMSYVNIQEAPLIPVIRYGEEEITVNYQTTLSMFATRSYDPDVINGNEKDGLTYEWICLQSSTANFSASSPCIPSLLPDVAVPEFSVPIAVLESESDIAFLQYTLLVRKGMDRVSPATTLVVELQNRGTLPFLDEYEILLTNDDGTVQGWNGVAHYERSIITVSTSSQVSWSYSLLEPSIPDFFSSSNLINSPLFFSAEADVYTVSGNTKPLGIEAGRLNPHTTYKFKILFDGSTEHEATSVVVSIRTAEAPILGFPVPSITQGTPNTTFTATAGIPRSWTTFSYYFILTDDSGKTFCVGGCTGYDVTHFRIGRVGTYTLTAYIFDMQGKALLDSKELQKNITIVEGGAEGQYLSTLDTLFAHGDDNTWTQLAHDLALILLEPELSQVDLRMLADDLERVEETATEDILAAKMQSALRISSGSRKIFCSSFPNSYHGSDCMSLSSDIVKMSLLDPETVYNIMVTVQCCVENTPQRTINKMGPMFIGFLQDLNRLSRTIDQGGNSRRRLLQTSGEPANLLADVHSWTSRQMSAAVTSGKLEGYNEDFQIGTDGEFGELSIVVASNPGHVPAKIVNGEQRRIVIGPSENELFYARDACLTKLFAPSADKKRFLVLHTVDNFILEGFQDPPKGSNLADKLYWQQVFEKDSNGRFVPTEVAKEDPCFCWRLPVVRKQQMLEDSVDLMAGMFAVSDLKEFGQDALSKGEVYNYVYEGILTSEYNATDGWVEACQDQLGLVGSTMVSRTANNAVGNGTASITGTGGLVIVGLVIGGLLFVVVAMVSAWVFAARSMADVAAPLAALAPNELYVERDVYGRGTIFDVNAVSLPSN